MKKAGEKLAMSPKAVARAVAYAIEQPDDINIGRLSFARPLTPKQKWLILGRHCMLLREVRHARDLRSAPPRQGPTYPVAAVTFIDG